MFSVAAVAISAPATEVSHFCSFCYWSAATTVATVVVLLLLLSVLFLLLLLPFLLMHCFGAAAALAVAVEGDANTTDINPYVL